MSRRIIALMCVLCVAAVLGVDRQAQAQLFGPRQLGTPLTRRTPPGENPGGTIRGNERFLRENRARLDFVGIDIDDRQTFVGEQQGRVIGDVRPAAQDLQRRRPPNANTEQTSTGNSGPLYAPRLSIDFSYMPAAQTSTATELQEVFTAQRMGSRWERLEVTVQERTAILRGVVASHDDRHVAVALARLEPGVSQVVDEIRVESPP